MTVLCTDLLRSPFALVDTLMMYDGTVVAGRYERQGTSYLGLLADEEATTLTYLFIPLNGVSVSVPDLYTHAMAQEELVLLTIDYSEYLPTYSARSLPPREVPEALLPLPGATFAR